MKQNDFAILRRLVKSPITRDQLVAVPHYENIYEVKNSFLTKYVYWDGFAISELYGEFTGEGFQSINLEACYQWAEKINEYAREGDFSTIISLTNDKFRYFIFNEFLEYLLYRKSFNRYSNSEKELIYDLFIETYQNMDYGFDLFKARFIERMQRYSVYSAKRKMRMEMLSAATRKSNSNYLTVFHGEQNPSVKDFYSWTLDPNIAYKFAMFGQFPGRIWSINISLIDPIDFLIDRDELEILLPYRVVYKFNKYPYRVIYNFNKYPANKDNLDAWNSEFRALKLKNFKRHLAAFAAK